MDTLTGMKRTDYCGNFTTEQIGQEVTVYGWAQRQRDLGNLIFIDLRDRTGILQLSFNDATDREIFAKAQSVRSEYVLAATGTLQKRESVNKELKTCTCATSGSPRICSCATKSPRLHGNTSTATIL